MSVTFANEPNYDLVIAACKKLYEARERAKLERAAEDAAKEKRKAS